MELQVRSVEPDLVCLQCRGMIRQPLGKDLTTPLQLLNNQHWGGKVLLNLGEAEYIDSSGIAWLIEWHRNAEQAGGVLALCEVPPRIADVLRMCQLDRVFRIWKDEAAARAALVGSAPHGPTQAQPAASGDGTAGDR